jgi:hypothetical protein
MRCPVCKIDQSHIIDSRPSAKGFATRRRLVCACGNRFTTYERIEEKGPTIEQQVATTLKGVDTHFELLQKNVVHLKQQLEELLLEARANSQNVKMPPEARAQMCREYATGEYTYSMLAAKWNVSYSYVNTILVEGRRNGDLQQRAEDDLRPEAPRSTDDLGQGEGGRTLGEAGAALVACDHPVGGSAPDDRAEVGRPSERLDVDLHGAGVEPGDVVSDDQR